MSVSIYIKKSLLICVVTCFSMDYCSKQDILIVGEEDFSFSLSLARTVGTAKYMVATTKYNQGTLEKKYLPEVSQNMKELRDLGCTILTEVNPKTMTQHYILQNRRFNRIIYNFPHAVFYRPESEGSQIQLHKNVVREFLQNAKLMLGFAAEIHINHKKKHPYSLWDIEFLASCEHLKLVGEVKFDQAHYPGYKINGGSGSSVVQSSVIGECSTFKFSY